MALQPYAARVPAQQQIAIQPQQMQRPVDPFMQMDMMMDQMMMSPFGGMGMGGPRGGLFGGLGMGGLLESMMMEPMGGGMGMGGCQMVSMQMGGCGGEGGFSSQTMVMSSTMGPDGKMHTERFSSSTVGDPSRQIAESQQAYSNSQTMMEKMALERQMGDRARKMVKEYNRQSGDERSTDMFRGMTEADTQEFDAQWRQNAQPYLQHQDIRTLMAPQSAPVAIGQAATGAARQPVVYAAAEPTVYAAREPTVYAAGASPGVAGAATGIPPVRAARVFGEATAPQTIPASRPTAAYAPGITRVAQQPSRFTYS